jgi:hypothetical protein
MTTENLNVYIPFIEKYQFYYRVPYVFDYYGPPQFLKFMNFYKKYEFFYHSRAEPIQNIRILDPKSWVGGNKHVFYNIFSM